MGHVAQDVREAAGGQVRSITAGQADHGNDQRIGGAHQLGEHLALAAGRAGDVPRTQPVAHCTEGPVGLTNRRPGVGMAVGDEKPEPSEAKTKRQPRKRTTPRKAAANSDDRRSQPAAVALHVM